MISATSDRRKSYFFESAWGSSDLNDAPSWIIIRVLKPPSCSALVWIYDKCIAANYSVNLRPCWGHRRHHEQRLETALWWLIWTQVHVVVVQNAVACSAREWNALFWCVVFRSGRSRCVVDRLRTRIAACAGNERISGHVDHIPVLSAWSLLGCSDVEISHIQLQIIVVKQRHGEGRQCCLKQSVAVVNCLSQTFLA